MSSPNPPRPPRAGSVTSLVDRLPAQQRARHLTALALRDQVRDRTQLERFTELAAKIESFNAEATMARFLRSHTHDPDLPRGIVACKALIAARRYLQGDAEGALAEFARLIEESPQDASEVYYFRSMFLELRGDLDAAIDDANRLIALSPTDASGYARRGDLLRRADRDDEALANFLRAAQLDPDNLVALAGIGVCAIATEQWERGIHWLSRAIKVRPSMATLRRERAYCYESLDRYDEAIADLEEALALDPDDAESWYARGRCRPETQRAEAIADYSRALEIDPRRGETLSARATLRLLGEDHDAAFADASLALEINPEIAGAHFARGVVHHMRGDLVEAKEEYEVAVRLAPEEDLYTTALSRVEKALATRSTS